MPYTRWSVDDVRTIRMEDKQEAFGLLMRLPANGRIFHFYREAVNDEWVPGVYRYQTSCDGGYTWDDARPLTQLEPDTDYGISGGVTPAGTIIICLWKISISQRRSVGLFVIRSTDEGRTWSAPAAIPGGYHVTYGQLLVTPGGIALPCYKYPSIDQPFILDLVFSHDDGITWCEAKPVKDAAHPTFLSNEAALVHTDGNTLLGYIRPERWIESNGPITDERSLLFMVSRDLGTTWKMYPTNIRPSYIPYGSTLRIWEMISPWIISPGLNPDQVTILFCEREYLSPTQNFGILRAHSAKPEDLIINQGWLGPTSKSVGQEIWRGDFHAFGYPSAVETPTGVLLAFHSQNTPGGQLNRYYLRMLRK